MNIIPFDAARVATDQPWLTEEEQARAEAINLDFMQLHHHRDMEPWMVEHLAARVDAGDQEAIRKLNPFSHYILTPDFRIVQEPNFVRWGIFLEKGKHRIIEQTDVCKGTARERPCLEQTWSRQQRYRRNYFSAPSFKIEETRVSTVFIGTGLDELFETMIFGGWLNTVRWKNTTLEAAKKAHWSAVTLAHVLNRYIKRHGKAVRKDYVRMERFWRLAHKRGPDWAHKHVPVMERVERRLQQIPGEPSFPQGDFLVDLAQTFLSRQPVTP